MKTPIAERDIFTTGQVAEICNVSPRTVRTWIDEGRLKGYRIPGGARQHRRVARAWLVKFLKDNGMPLGELAEGGDA